MVSQVSAAYEKKFNEPFLEERLEDYKKRSAGKKTIKRFPAETEEDVKPRISERAAVSQKCIELDIVGLRSASRA